MPLVLGAAFAPRIVEVDEPRPPTLEDLRTEQLMVALAGLQDALNHMPAPVVHVDQPDLTAIVQAVTQLKGPATPEEIARAIREEIAPTPAPTMEPVLAELVEALKTLDFRLKGIGGSSGGGGVGSRVQNVDGSSLDTREAQQETRYDWQAAGASSVPLYIGSAAPGTPTTTASWRIDKYTYILGPAGDQVPSTVQTVTGAWDSRASLF